MTTKKEKVKVIYQENYNKGTFIQTQQIENTLKDNKGKVTSEILNRGKMSNGDEFISVKLIVKTS